MSSFPEVLDSSMLATFKSCPEKFRKEYIEHWRPKEPSVHLHAGAAFARGLEVARRGFFEYEQNAPTAIAQGVTALRLAYGDFACPEDSAKSLPRMVGALEYYFANYPLERGVLEPLLLATGKRAIEFSFAHPLEIDHPETGDPIIYCGRMDAILDPEMPMITDEKTTTSLGPTWSRQWDLRAQFTGYTWGCQQSKVPVRGATVRGVSILKTKYDTQQAFIKPAEWQIKRWYDEAHLWIAQMIACWQNNVWLHNLDHACADFGGCTFRRECASLDEEPYLKNYFERRVWNPLLRTETKL